jgi:dGTP triphosphohydrolase
VTEKQLQAAASRELRGFLAPGKAQAFGFAVGASILLAGRRALGRRDLSKKLERLCEFASAPPRADAAHPQANDEEEQMASVRTVVEKQIKKIEDELAELREELEQGGDFDSMQSSADTLGELGDKLASKLEKIAKAAGDEDSEQVLASEASELGTDSGEERSSASRKSKGSRRGSGSS